MVDGDDLVRAADELGVEGALDGLLHQPVPGAARKLARLPVDWLAVGLADLKHEGPVGACLLLAVWRLTAIPLHPDSHICQQCLVCEFERTPRPALCAALCAGSCQLRILFTATAAAQKITSVSPRPLESLTQRPMLWTHPLFHGSA